MAKAKSVQKHEPTEAFVEALRAGDDWFDALLAAIARWEAAEEVIDGRHYRYLIGGEAFDWLLLAERLLEETDGQVPVDEREALLFFGRPPRALEDDEFRRAIGDAKHRAHLNFVYGVAVEEALQLTVEEELLKERRSSVWTCAENVDQQVYERLYSHSRDELIEAFRRERALPPVGEMSYGDFRAFTYWLFKYRVSQNDPARVASDTRKALVQLSQLEMAARRRAQFLASAGERATPIIDGEVVAHLR
jgi:hypothetical protein